MPGELPIISRLRQVFGFRFLVVRSLPLSQRAPHRFEQRIEFERLGEVIERAVRVAAITVSIVPRAVIRITGQSWFCFFAAIRTSMPVRSSM